MTNATADTKSTANTKDWKFTENENKCRALSGLTASQINAMVSNRFPRFMDVQYNPKPDDHVLLAELTEVKERIDQYPMKADPVICITRNKASTSSDVIEFMFGLFGRKAIINSKTITIDLSSGVIVTQFDVANYCMT